MYHAQSLFKASAYPEALKARGKGGQKNGSGGPGGKPLNNLRRLYKNALSRAYAQVHLVSPHAAAVPFRAAVSFSLLSGESMVR